ncbi:MAG: Y-family DNA polymerase [Methyloceanibacter sp.]
MVSVWLPHWPIERLKRERAASRGAPAPDKSAPDESVPDDRPFALVGHEARGLLLTAINAQSHGEGLSPGMGLADARAICPHLLTVPADPAKDARALIALTRWSGRYSPILNVQNPDGLWLDVTGIPHLFGGENALLAHMAMRFEAFGFSARIAIAETLGAAHALARFARAPQTIVPSGKTKAALALLPVEALRLAPSVAALLKRLGLKRIGQLYDLPRPSLQRRFHSREAAEAVLLRLDQALGQQEEPGIPLLLAPHYVARLAFPEPLITADGIASALAHLAATLCEKLAFARVGAKRVRLTLYRSDGSAAEVEAGFSAPCRDPHHLLSLLQDKAANLDAGFGIDLMLLKVLLTQALPLGQVTLVEAPEKASAEPLIDRLANRLQAGAVRRLFPRQSHIPERAQDECSAFAGVPSWPAPVVAKPPRPTLLLSQPDLVTVLAEVPEGPPARFTWRRVTRRVVKAEGPERIAPEWWRELLGHSKTASAGPRDYYRIEDEDGRRYWVFREGLYQESAEATPVWYLHGVFG